MVTVGISKLRADLNKFLRKVQSGEVVTITVRGVEVARLVPPDYAQSAAREELEQLRARATVGDVLSPVIPAREWEAAG